MLLVLGGVMTKLVIDSGNSGIGDYLSFYYFSLLLSLPFLVASVLVPKIVAKRLALKKAPASIISSYKKTIYLKFIFLSLITMGYYATFLYFSHYIFLVTAVVVVMFFTSQYPTKKDINKVIRA